MKICEICGKNKAVEEYKKGDVLRIRYTPNPLIPDSLGVADEIICRECLDKRKKDMEDDDTIEVEGYDDGWRDNE